MGVDVPAALEARSVRHGWFLRGLLSLCRHVTIFLCICHYLGSSLKGTLVILDRPMLMTSFELNYLFINLASKCSPSSWYWDLQI